MKDSLQFEEVGTWNQYHWISILKWCLASKAKNQDLLKKKLQERPFSLEKIIKYVDLGLWGNPATTQRFYGLHLHAFLRIFSYIDLKGKE